jgi:hypothetical protein
VLRKTDQILNWHIAKSIRQLKVHQINEVVAPSGSKSLYINRVVSCFYETEFQIGAGFVPAGSTEISLKHPTFESCFCVQNKYR